MLVKFLEQRSGNGNSLDQYHPHHLNDSIWMYKDIRTPCTASAGSQGKSNGSRYGREVAVRPCFARTSSNRQLWIGSCCWADVGANNNNSLEEERRAIFRKNECLSSFNQTGILFYVVQR